MLEWVSSCMLSSRREVAYTLHPFEANSVALYVVMNLGLNLKRTQMGEVTYSAKPMPPSEHPVIRTTFGEAESNMVVSLRRLSMEG